jgi:thiol-disulfide isomerase/thioredoxin
MRTGWIFLPLLLLTAAAAGASTPVATPLVPTLSVTTLDGARWDLASRRGEWVVVNFWATWCAPCLKEIPDLGALDARHDDLSVIGLAYEEIGADDLRAFLLDHPARYPIAIVDVYAPPADFETPRGLPMTYLIAPDGKIAKRFLGPVTSDEVEQAMSAHAATDSAPASGKD